MSTKENYEAISSKVEEIIKKNNIKDTVQIVAVSKTFPVEKIQEAYDIGVRDFGENKAQEMRDKYALLSKDIRWHFIGRLQTNKVKYVVGRAFLIHSIDSIKLMKVVDSQSKNKNIISNVLVQVNVSGEESKAGISPDEVESFMKTVSELSNIKVKGLMTIGQLGGTTAETRECFVKLRKIFIDISKKNINNIDMELISMGMSNDFDIAIEEGSNIVRVGSAIFGNRKYLL